MVVLRKFNSPSVYLEEKSIMLSFQCCPTCHQELTVPSNQHILPNNTIKITTNKDNNTTNSMQIDIDISPIQISNINIIPLQNHCCNISNRTNTSQRQYPSSSESFSGINEKHLDNSYTLRNKPPQYVAPAISNRLSLCGGGLVSINTDPEPIETLTPSMILNNNNPFHFSKQDLDVVDFDTETEEFYYEEMSTDKSLEDDEMMNCHPVYSRESSVSSLNSQMSPNIPLSFVLPRHPPPQTSLPNNSRPLSLQLESVTDLHRRCESRPLSMNLSSTNQRRDVQNKNIQQLRMPTNNNQVYDGDARSLWQGPVPVKNIELDIRFLPLLQTLIPQSPESELVQLSKLEKRLEMCNWYYGDLTWQKSEDILKWSSPGTFFIRNSSASKHLYSLSIQTKNGPTNIRVVYLNGLYSLNSDDKVQPYMPQFTCVLRLVEYYVNFTIVQGKRKKNPSNPLYVEYPDLDNNKYFKDSTGAVHSEISLRKPLYNEVPSLKHLSRLKIHEAITFNDQPKLPLLPGYSLLELPKCLVDYLGEYPYCR